MRIIGHRGASGVAPENTLAAFRRAVQMGAQYIETDLQLTKDARLVVLHDDTLQRTTSGRGPVASKTLAALQELEAGSWFRKRGLTERFAEERIPTLEEALDFAREHEIGLYLEMKTKPASGGERVLVETLRAMNAADRVCVISFDLAVLAQVRALNSSLALGYLFSRPRRDAVLQAVDAGAGTLLPRRDRVKPKLIAEAKQHHLQVVTWTVNDPRQMKALMKMGVDGIMSDYPDRLAAILRG